VTTLQNQSPTLTYDVFALKRPGLTRDLPPGTESLQWVANTATLIAGSQDAVLGDTFAIIDQNRQLVDWIKKSGKNKNPENSDSPQHIAAIQQYIRDFNRLNHETTTARELYDKMLSLYPDRVNPGSLWGSAKAAKAENGGH
jgi:hypothetical protein